MARRATPSDFDVTVEGIGTFSFARRKLTDELDIQVEYARILNGVQPTNWLALVGGWLSALKVLTVRAPEGWNIDDMDPLDDETYAKLGRVHQALIDKERSFRSKAQAGSEGARQGDGGNG